jgi:TRAP-type C4-dicarboxylate transport system substrate-binding protein
LSPAKRDRLLAAATQAARESDALAREEAALLALRRQGMTVQRLSEAQRELFRQAVAPMFEKWAGIAGAELVEAARRAVAASGGAR